MSWLRIDDGFAAHPKIAALSDKDLRVWLRVGAELGIVFEDKMVLLAGAARLRQ